MAASLPLMAARYGDYFDVDAILSEEERCPVRFAEAAVSLGHLDSSCADKDLPEGACVDLPLWLARSLHRRGKAVLTAPRCFNGAFRARLLADPKAINLRDKNAHFYELGLKLSPLLGDKAMADSLIKTFMPRYLELLDKSQSLRSEDVNAYTSTLTQLERGLFVDGYRSSSAFQRWRQRSSAKLVASHLVQHAHKRRKLEKPPGGGGVDAAVAAAAGRG